MLNRWVRYLPIIDLLKKDYGVPVLEVGSGSIGLGEFLDQPFVGCDVLFNPKELARTIMPVTASGTKLPFRDGAFHTVLCLDTMEHVPRAARRPFVRELLRVTGSVLIIGAPMGAKASSADRKLHEYFLQEGREVPIWLKEHMELIADFPAIKEFEEMFGEAGVAFAVRRGESAFFHRAVIILEHTRYVGRVVKMWSANPLRILISPFLRLVNYSSTYRTYLVARK